MGPFFGGRLAHPGLLLALALAASLPAPATARAGAFDPGFRAPADLIRSQTAAVGVAAAPDGDVYVALHDRVVRLQRDGSADPQFGASGVVTLPHHDAVEALESLPDGRLVVALRSGQEAALLRYRADGRADRSFGDGGRVSYPSPGGAYLALRADGTVGVAGRVVGSQTHVFVGRITPAGGWDPRFGRHGRVEVDLGTLGLASAVGFDRDDLLVALSTERPYPARDLLWLGRFGRDGAPDAALGANGMRAVGTGLAWALAVQADGRTIMGGSEGDAAVWRVGRDGRRDPSFGQGGAHRQARAAWVSDLALQPDGRVVLALNGAGTGPVLVRLSARGARDRTFTAPRPPDPLTGMHAGPADIRLDSLVQARDGRVTAVGAATVSMSSFFAQRPIVVRHLSGDAALIVEAVVARGRALRARVRCRAPHRTRCRSVLRLTTTRRGRRIAVGGTSLSLLAGGRGTRTVALTAAGRRLVGARGVHVRAETVTRDAIGHVDVRRRTLRVRTPAG